MHKNMVKPFKNVANISRKSLNVQIISVLLTLQDFHCMIQNFMRVSKFISISHLRYFVLKIVWYQSGEGISLLWKMHILWPSPFWTCFASYFKIKFASISEDFYDQVFSRCCLEWFVTTQPRDPSIGDFLQTRTSCNTSVIT